MKVLLVEDEMLLAEATIKKFKNKNIDVIHTYDGQKALDLIMLDNFDIVILDIMLPSMDGLEIVKNVRNSQNNVPIILTSAKNQTVDKIAGLNVGADDYLGKPYDFDELIARIHTNLRRSETAFNFEQEENKVSNLICSRNILSIYTDVESTTLTLKEFNLLEYLIKSYPNIISKDQIIEKIWGFNSDTLPNQVEVYICYLRKKLELIKASVEIKTVRGLGYKLVVTDV